MTKIQTTQTEKSRRVVLLLALAVLLAAQAAYCIYYGGMKQDLYVDGYYTFELSNSHGFSGIFGSSITPQDYAHDYFSAAGRGRLNYPLVWQNQVGDVHPPFYYLIIHTLCAVLAPGFAFPASVWLAMGVNIAFALGSTLLVFAIVRRLTGRAAPAFTAAALAAFSPVMIEHVTFIRMYTMAGFWVLLAVWWHVKSWDKPLGPRAVLPLLLCTAAGILTHYYVLIYLFFAALWFGVRLLLRRRWRDAAWYAGGMLGGVGLSVLVFPGMLYHIFAGERGTQAVGNLTESSLTARLFGPAGMLGQLNKFMFCGGIAIVFILLALLGGGYLITRITARRPLGLDRPELMLLAVSAAYFVLITKIEADTYLRYLYILCLPLLGVLVALLWRFCRYFGRLVARERLGGALACLLAAAFGVAEVAATGPQTFSYLYPETAQAQAQIEADGARELVWMGGSPWKTMQLYRAMEPMDTLHFVDADDPASLGGMGLEGKPFYLALEGSLSSDELLAAVEEILPGSTAAYRFDMGDEKLYLVTQG